jgi:hypothetical protein
MKNPLYLLVIITILTRLFCIYIFKATEISNEWGVMVSIIEKNHIIGFREIDGEVMPSIFMPPLYPIFLYLIKIFFNNLDYYLLTIQFIQLLFSIVSTVYIIKILSKFFSTKVTYIGGYIFSLFPLNIYGVSQISSITMQIFLTTIYFYTFLQLLKAISKKNIILLSLSSALLILLRGEFFIFYIYSLIFFIFKKKIKIFIAILSFTTLLISPYIIRNYSIFETVTITKSSGFNLFKGNNPTSNVEGSPMLNLDDINKISKETYEKAIKIKKQPKYDLIIDNLYKEEAINFIKSDPIRYIKLYIAKLFSFIFIDLNSTYPNYYNFFHTVPKILISISTLMGIFFLINKKNLLNFFSLYYLLNAFIFSIFFILPRYSLALLPLQIILSCAFIDKINKRI